MSSANLGVAVQDLSITYRTAAGPRPAISDLSLTVAPGTFVSILGPSGCGKSTLIKAVAGLLSPSCGGITVGGREVSGPAPEVGIVFQKPTLLPWKSVIDNILIGARAQRLGGEEARARADRLIALVRLKGVERNYPHELSGGMQQRVAIARALLLNPSVLVMDEPFAALDALTRERMGVEMQELWAGVGKTVIFVTHSITEAVFLSDRIVVLSPAPAKIITDINIELPIPRSRRLMSTSEFGNYCDHLREQLYKFEDV